MISLNFKSIERLNIINEKPEMYKKSKLNS